jgi:hypothetical protein
MTINDIAEQLELNESQRVFLVQALRIAATVYDADAVDVMKGAGKRDRETYERLKKQFEAQAQDARDMADRAERAAFVKFGWVEA